MTQRLGWLILIAVGIVPIALFSSKPAMFLSLKAIIMVLTGTFAIALVSRPGRELKLVLRYFFEVHFARRTNLDAIADEVDSVFTQLHRRPDAVDQVMGGASDPLFRYGLGLLGKGVDAEALLDILDKHCEAAVEERDVARQSVVALSRFPPALGLLATVLAMINVLENMSSGTMGVAGLGPAMAAGLVATFYGIALSNLILSPAAEAMAEAAQREGQRLRLVAGAFELYLRGQPPIVIREALLALRGRSQGHALRGSRSGSGADAA